MKNDEIFCRRCGGVASVEYIYTYTSHPVITKNGREIEASKLYFMECSCCHVKTGLYHAIDFEDMRVEWENAPKLYAPKNHTITFKYISVCGCGIDSAKKVEIYRGGRKIIMVDNDNNEQTPPYLFEGGVSSKQCYHINNQNKNKR